MNGAELATWLLLGCVLRCWGHRNVHPGAVNVGARTVKLWIGLTHPRLEDAWPQGYRDKP